MNAFPHHSRRPYLPIHPLAKMDLSSQIHTSVLPWGFTVTHAEWRKNPSVDARPALRRRRRHCSPAALLTADSALPPASVTQNRAVCVLVGGPSSGCSGRLDVPYGDTCRAPIRQESVLLAMTPTLLSQQHTLKRVSLNRSPARQAVC